jgi:peptidoglycan/LPS O-acetylase OafA/YrhL
MKGQFLVIPLFGIWIASVFYSKSKIYNNKVMVYLGNISYSFYIWQFAAIEFGRYIIKNHSSINLHLLVLLCLSVNIAMSSISYFFIEEPFRRLILKLSKKSV